MSSELGSRVLTGVQDGTAQAGGPPGFNPYLPGTGWVVALDTTDLNVPLTSFEVYHIALDGPIGSLGTCLINGKVWSFFDGWANEWDPAQPMIIQSGQVLQFAWNVAFAAGPYNKTTNIQPTVTVWLRQPA